MTPVESDADALERIKLLRPVQDWATFRDGEQWDRLRAVYAPGATTAVSWFDGSASEFVDRCQQMAAGGAVAAHHVMGTSQADRHGDRALVDSRVTILMRLELHGVLCDVTAVSRFVDRVVQHDGAWLIARRVAVFEKDGIQPVHPGDRLELDRAKLDSYPASYRFCTYALVARGGVPNLSLPAPGSAALAALYATERAWLAGSSATPARAPSLTTWSAA